jgi:hypothetical protein
MQCDILIKKICAAGALRGLVKRYNDGLQNRSQRSDSSSLCQDCDKEDRKTIRDKVYSLFTQTVEEKDQELTIMRNSGSYLLGREDAKKETAEILPERKPDDYTTRYTEGLSDGFNICIDQIRERAKDIDKSQQ